MKKSLKLITVLLMIVMMCTMSSVCFASNYTEIITGVGNGTAANTNTIQTTAANIVATLRNIAAIAAVVIIAILGVKYMLGSVEEKAEYKKSFMPLIIGIVVVLASTSIAAFIFDMV